MRLSIEHRTSYRFTAPQARVVQLLRMTPRNSHDQTVAEWHISVDCDARLREHRDGFGNRTTMLYAEGPLDGIEIAVAGEVVTSSSRGVLHGTFEPLPPALYLRATPTTVADAAIEDFARSAVGGAAPIPALHALNRALHERFTVSSERPDPGLTATDAFARASATPRDLAQLFVAAARALAVPARYVTGYCDLQDGRRVTPHGWAEAWVDDLGWIGFDPTLGESPEEHHVRVAVALDATGSSPVAGSRLGEGRECLEVEVQVSAQE
ncbi:transglutaminase family protein [Sphingomonas phyllosphaerae]|uniref:transglutaminase family protein n=1 Tax=Sphingomonas phyllosphaerae TaxID=257003 RepID=UPI0024132736|nr:transglutaminase family protein [Sphingomonas phyllosphaerae]